MKVLVIDIGGTSIKAIATGRRTRVRILSGPELTPESMVRQVQEAVAGWEYDVVSIGYPGPVKDGKPTKEPKNLGRGWVGFNFERAFGRPVKVVNDAAMQALGSYEKGTLLFLGLGTGLGSTLILDGVLAPMELAHLPYKKGGTYEDYVGKAGLKRFGKIVSVSPAAAQFARDAYHIESQVVPNAVEIKRFLSKPKFDSRIKKIVFLGRLVERKGASQLVDAFALLLKSDPEARLVIAGDGPKRAALEAKVSKLGIGKQVEFLGYIDEIAKPQLLAEADIACFPSLYGESFGIVLIEAMAAGSRVILAGDNPGYRSVLGQQPELLIDPSQTTRFAERLHLLLSDQDKIARLHEWQQASVPQYDIGIVGTRLVSIYNGQIARLAKKSNNKAHE